MTEPSDARPSRRRALQGLGLTAGAAALAGVARAAIVADPAAADTPPPEPGDLSRAATFSCYHFRPFTGLQYDEVGSDPFSEATTAPVQAIVDLGLPAGSTITELQFSAELAADVSFPFFGIFATGLQLYDPSNLANVHLSSTSASPVLVTASQPTNIVLDPDLVYFGMTNNAGAHFWPRSARITYLPPTAALPPAGATQAVAS